MIRFTVHGKRCHHNLQQSSCMQGVFGKFFLDQVEVGWRVWSISILMTVNSLTFCFIWHHVSYGWFSARVVDLGRTESSSLLPSRSSSAGSDLQQRTGALAHKTIKSFEQETEWKMVRLWKNWFWNNVMANIAGRNYSFPSLYEHPYGMTSVLKDMFSSQ